ncbi:MAG: AbgT family transporter [Bacilli bacterium]
MTKKISFTYFFGFMIFIVLLLSVALGIIEFSSTMKTINGLTGTITSEIVVVKNLLSYDNIGSYLGGFTNAFASKSILVPVIISMIGIGVLINSGLLRVLCHFVNHHLKRKTVIFLISLISIITAVHTDFGYLIIMPIAAYYFHITGRNPFIGIFVSFASLAIGSGLNIFVNSTDLILMEYTKYNATTISPNFDFSVYYNIFFSLVFIIISTFAVTKFTEKIIVKRFPNIKETPVLKLSNNEIVGLLMVSMVNIVTVLIFTMGIFPKTNFTGFLISNNDTNYFQNLLGYNSIFNTSFIFLISFSFILSSIVFLYGSKTYKNHKNILIDSLNEIGKLLILIFMSYLLIYTLSESKIGEVISLKLIGIFEGTTLTSYPLIILFIVIVAIINILIPYNASKWVFISPIIVPLFMSSNINPEFTLLLFKIGSSITNAITPFLPFFVIYLYLLDKYKTEEISVKDGIKYMYPYTLLYTTIFIIFVLAWYMIGLPIGLNVFPSL